MVKPLLAALVAVALPAAAAGITSFTHAQGWMVTLHDDGCLERQETQAYFASIPRSQQAKYATFTSADKVVTPGCWMPSQGMVLLLYIDGDQQAIKQDRFSKSL